jgi:integrase
MKLTTRNGKLWITFYHQSTRYRRSLDLDDTKANRKVATLKLIPEILYKLNSGTFFDAPMTQTVPTVDEFAKISFKLHEVHRKPSTLIRMNSNYKKHILPHFKGKQLDKVRPSHISLWQNMLLTDHGLSPKRVKDIRTVLSVIFEDAVQDEIIENNPVRKASKLPTHIQAPIVPFAIDEINKILECADGQFKNFFATAFFTGMRTGELLGLKWEDVNFDTMEITVQRTIGRGIISTPKTVNSIRTIEILDVLKPYLMAQHKITGIQNSFVFLNENNTHYFDSNKIRDYTWKKTLQEAGVEYRTLYNIRHTFASMMISNGEDILWVSHMLGHAHPDMTLRKYAKYVKNNKKKRATFLENEINSY